MNRKSLNTACRANPKVFSLAVMLCQMMGSACWADSPDAFAFFENKVRPLLVEKCHECHGEDEQSGDVRLDGIEHMLASEIIVPGKPDESFLIEVISDESYEMPPDGRLSDDEIAVLVRWIRIGAPWPGRDPDTPLRTNSRFDEEDQNWWAIARLKSPVVPPLEKVMRDWCINDIDRFISRSMQSEGLVPAPLASKRTIIRRLTFDLTGLPPTPKQIDEFLSDSSDDAYESMVDRLLESKAYGEHAARWWLDLVRYAESDGYRADEFRPTAWRYRDYVIRSLCDDKPYDRFVQEQLAADELFPEDLEAQVGLGYLRHWVYEWNIRDARTQWNTIMEDLTDTTADVFMGLGLQCAKCHNHKFDPLLQQDYFRLRAFFEAFIPDDVTLADSNALRQYQQELAAWKNQTHSIRSQIAEIEAPYRKKYRRVAIDRFPRDLQAIARKSADEKTPHDHQLAYLVQRQVQAEYDQLQRYMSAEDKERIITLNRALKEYDEIKPEPLPTAMAVTEVGPIAPPTILPKGNSISVKPGVPTIIDASEITIDADPSGLTTGRRSALARWLTQPDNPLTSRVIANRIWQTHFGRGLASNASDFGTLGGTPTHPDLLDYLATKLIEENWSLKSLHRRIVMSATYRQSTRHPDFRRQQQIDPTNRHYWRADTRRLSAEQIRDSLLLVSGTLKNRDGGPSVSTDSPYRTIYTRVMRNSADPLLRSFDLPQFFSSNSARNTTTTPLQSLLLINSDQMLGYARRLSDQVARHSHGPRERVHHAWQIVFGRDATGEEIDASVQFLSDQRSRLTRTTEKPGSVIETAKLPYRDGQAVRMTLDSSMLKLVVPHHGLLDFDDFTIECYFELRSIAKTGAVRTIISKWEGDLHSPGWRFGVTGEGSRRKPQTLVLQMVQLDENGKAFEVAIFSDQHVDLNTPYYAAASFRPTGDGQSGSVTFYLKDLSNDDEVLSVVDREHTVAGKLRNRSPLLIGRRGGNSPQPFDGLIDDVRLTGRAIEQDEILYASETQLDETIGLWRFESDDGVMTNAAVPELSIQATGNALIELSPDETTLADFCHALLNSNEFLYVH